MDKPRARWSKAGLVLAALVGLGACTQAESEPGVEEATSCEELSELAKPVMIDVTEQVLSEVVGMDFEDFSQQADDEVPGFTEFEQQLLAIEEKAVALSCDPGLGETLVCEVLPDVEAPDDEPVAAAIVDGLIAECRS